MDCGLKRYINVIKKVKFDSENYTADWKATTCI